VPLAALLIGAPLGFTLLFGTIYKENVVNYIPLAVYDEDQSSLSRQFIQSYRDSDRFTVTDYVSTEEEMRQTLLEGRALAVLEIPRDFSRDIHLGRGSDAMLMVNSANNMFGNAALSASQEIARSFSLAVSANLLEAGGLLPAAAWNNAYPVRLGVRITGNPANGYTSLCCPA
jgi:ABC-2 type transport system permease protein